MGNKYNQDDILLIASHLTPLIVTATKTAEKYCKINQRVPSEQARGSIVYWTNVASGLKWALEMAAQQQERTPPKNGDHKQHPKAGTSSRR